MHKSVVPLCLLLCTLPCSSQWIFVPFSTYRSVLFERVSSLHVNVYCMYVFQYHWRIVYFNFISRCDSVVQHETQITATTAATAMMITTTTTSPTSSRKNANHIFQAHTFFLSLLRSLRSVVERTRNWTKSNLCSNKLMECNKNDVEKEPKHWNWSFREEKTIRNKY